MNIPLAYVDKVFNEDVMIVLKKLPSDCVDMIYADPDYNVGINYAGQTYTKKWEDYIDWYSELIQESMRVLKPTGNLFTINYPKQNAYLWVKCLDQIAFEVSEYAWVYNSNVGHSRKKFTTAHRSILHATKSKDNCFFKDQVAQPYKNPSDERIKKRIAEGSNGRMPYSWFYFDLVKNVSKDKTFHSCQIPVNLTRMLMRASTKPGDLVFILFGGSGSEITLAMAEKRRYLSCEISAKYFEMIEDRIRNNGEIKEHFKCLAKDGSNSATTAGRRLRRNLNALQNRTR